MEDRMERTIIAAMVMLLAFALTACSSDDDGDPAGTDPGPAASADTSGGTTTDPGPGTSTDPGPGAATDDGAEPRVDPGGAATPDPGTQPAPDPGGAMPDATETSFGKVIQSNVPREEAPEISAADKKTFSDGNASFAWDAYEWLAGKEAGNIFFSPHSISVALSMTYAGAKGETASEMESALHLDLGQEGTHEGFNYLDYELASREDYEPPEGEEGDAFRLRVANSLWGHIAMTFLEAFLDTLAQNYGAGLRALDFGADPEGARQLINSWVETKTEGRIKDLIPEGAINALTRLVLVNAIYFKASWLNPFEESLTKDGDFKTLAGDTVTAQMMTQVEGFAHVQRDGFSAVEMPYVGRDVAMLAILPDEGRFAEIEASLDPDEIAAIRAGYTYGDVELTFPKFENRGSYSLVPMFSDLGMTKAFSPGGADFSGMAEGVDLFISGIFHKSFVKVDETGTEAAAATAVVIGTTSVPPPPVPITFDRPFVYLILDKPTGAILFMGRMADPTG